jgi:branched-chain amino acid transport system substrate-binding protein
MMAWTTAAATALLAAGPAPSQQREIVIGAQCDRSGPTQIVGVNLCPAYQDYVNLVNVRGGVEGYRIKADELDNEYKVPPAVEAYERHKAEGAISIMIYGTPQTQALTQKLNEIRFPYVAGLWHFGGGQRDRYPYLFPIAATYWSQGAAAIKFVKDKLGGA